MKVAKVWFVLGAAGAFVACRPDEVPAPQPLSFAIVCTAEVLSPAGMPVLSIEDTMRFDAPDSVATDPRPCRSSYHRGTKTLTLNAKEAVDTATGDPRD